MLSAFLLQTAYFFSLLLGLLEVSSNFQLKAVFFMQKVFPEAISIANGDNQHDDLPSDDSEDYDYEPDGPEVNVEDHKEESDFTSASKDSDASNSNKQNENFGFSSDDSEDNDYDPDAPDLDKSIPKNGSSSDESDFTSDSDEFCNELSKTSGANEDSASSLQNLKPIVQSGEGTCGEDINNSELLSTSEPDLNQENELVFAKRQIERLDYKKLYDVSFHSLNMLYSFVYSPSCAY